nr:RNA-directed DNA polymerase, eukaryota [Tanacetum cinerariifolium]
MTGKKAHIADYQEFKGSSTGFRGSNGRITGKFDGKSNLGFLVGYSLNIKAFKVYNLETKKVKETLHVNFLENKPNVAGKGHAWMFDLDYLTSSLNYEPVLVENQANKSASLKEANNSAGTQANDDQSTKSEEIDLHEDHFVLHIKNQNKFITSNSFSVLNDEEEDDEVENVYDESANLFKTGGSLSFTAADDQGNATDDILYKRMEIIKDIQEAEKVDNLEAAQKAKIKWAIECDENIKFYHGILNKKRNQLGIRGVLKDGIWIDNPVVVKKEFLEHFSTRFQ